MILFAFPRLDFSTRDGGTSAEGTRVGDLAYFPPIKSAKALSKLAIPLSLVWSKDRYCQNVWSTM